MVLMAVCGAMVLAGLVLVVRWGGLEIERPWPVPDPHSDDAPPAAGDVARRYLWYVTVAVVSGLGAGVLIAGAGGRLAMRLLAATAGDDAQGAVTEADQIVGTISADGTISFIVFTALFFGMGTAALYLLIRRWLPRGRLGGLAFGAVLLVVGASRVDPLRRDNPDFDIVGPGWLSVVVFGAMALAHGMLVAALAGRYSRSLPLLGTTRRSAVAHLPLLLLAPMAPVALPVAAVGGLTVLASRFHPVLDGVRSQGFTVAGRVALAALVLVALPGFVAASADIAGRGP
jgi:hypothetical protein